MVSFILVQIPNIELDGERIKVNLSIYKDENELKSGLLPETVISIDDVVAFDFAFEKLVEHEVLDVNNVKKLSIKVIERVPVIFAGDVLAIGKCKKEVEEKVVEFIERNLINDFKLERIEFDQNTLRTVVETASDVLQVNITPRKRGHGYPDQLKIIGRRVTETKVWEDYGDEPLERIKIIIPEFSEEVRVSFCKRGEITIYNKNLPVEIRLIAIKYIVENIVRPYISRIFQSTLRGWY